MKYCLTSRHREFNFCARFQLQVYCEAYREQHDVVKNSNIAKGDLVGARLLSWVEDRQHEGTTFYTTKYVVQDIELWSHCEPDHF